MRIFILDNTRRRTLPKIVDSNIRNQGASCKNRRRIYHFKVQGMPLFLPVLTIDEHILLFTCLLQDPPYLQKKVRLLVF
jgi:hypothetical protein